MQNDEQVKKFQDVYKQLNEQQKIAVDTIDGPVMVIAGPGTGKTQILASRIGKILLETDTQPYNILCLTYTDAGAVAMRKRLQSFIGAAAYKVNISTYHAFCNEIIQQNLSVFEKNILEPVSDLESIGIFRELIDGFKPGNPLKRYRGDVYYEINNLRSLFNTLKKEGWPIEEIKQHIDAALAALPTTEGYFYARKYKQFNAGDPKQALIDAEYERAEKLKAALDAFPEYNRLMQVHNRYDYNDMINWVIQAFTEHPNILAQYQEQYLYILVDEFQDSSGTQNKIVDLLISYWEKPNVFVVGDDDQSIFRFQGANVSNMKFFSSKYEQDLQKIILTKNYRSVQPILDSAMGLIANNADRLVNQDKALNKNLVASNPERINPLQPEINFYATQQDEMIAITLEIEKRIKEGTDPASIAVIYKENKYGEQLAQFLHLKNIAYYSKRNMNLFDQPLAKKIIHILYYLASEMDVAYSGDEMLFQLLHFNWFGIAPNAIAKETMELANLKYQKENRVYSLRQLLVEKSERPKQNLFDESMPEPLSKAIQAMEKLLKDISNCTFQQLFQNILNELGVLQFIMQRETKYRDLQVVTALFDLVKEETHRNPSMHLEAFVNMLQTMEKEEIALPLYQVNGTEQGVSLLTCHGCKGLEFNTVFVVGVNAHLWEKKRARADGYNLAKFMHQHNADTDTSAGLDLEELRRLFYVSVTRAEEHLYISCFNAKPDGKETEPSLFIAELKDTGKVTINPLMVLDETRKIAFQVLELKGNQQPVVEKLEEEIISKALDKFTMNVTALNAYLRCPLSFYYQNLIRIPSPKNENTEFGSAVHYALEQLFKKMMDSGTAVPDKKFPEKDIFIKDFEWYMQKHRESFTKEQFKKRMEYGPVILSDYYDKYHLQWQKVVTVERMISKVVVKNVPLKGKIDKLEFDGKLVNVVDYKTGDYEKAKTGRKQFDRPNEKNENGGDYWRQAVFYKILIDHYPLKDWNVISTEFDFVEPNKKKEYFKEKIVITPEDITTVTTQIVQVWDKIQNHEFYTGCGKEDCVWCNFVKDNKLDTSTETEEPETDKEIKEPLSFT